MTTDHFLVKTSDDPTFPPCQECENTSGLKPQSLETYSSLYFGIPIRSSESPSDSMSRLDVGVTNTTGHLIFMYL